MIRITEKANCCGCEACVQACPKQCISFNEDAEGFCYPKVNEAICIKCGICEYTCPNLFPYNSRIPITQLAGINPNNKVRQVSSSGGIFSMLAERVIETGGVVFGVRFNQKWQAVFDYTETIEGLAPFRGSKYVQARVGNTFVAVKNFLKQGRKVLFTGTPCQISAIRHFLKRDYDNLLLVDIICHGVPSPKVWKLYLNEITHNDIQSIQNINFRDKKQGWKRYHIDISYEHLGQIHSHSVWHQKNHFMRIFLNEVIIRPSCHSCKSRAGKSGSDITIADFWGIENLNSQMDDDGGTSLVLIYTEKGMSEIESRHLNTWTAEYKDVLRLNPSLEFSKNPHPKRSLFFAKLDSAKSIIRLIDDVLYVTLFTRIKRRFKLLIGKII